MKFSKESIPKVPVLVLIGKAGRQQKYDQLEYPPWVDIGLPRQIGMQLFDTLVARQCCRIAVYSTIVSLHSKKCDTSDLIMNKPLPSFATGSIIRVRC
jgi:hypothetical protein